MQVVVSIKGLSKTFAAGFWKTKRVVALENLTLQVHENEVFGYLGPNGAGKSTTLKLLMSLIYPTSGTAEILGKSVYEVSTRRHIGFLPENPYFYEYLTAEEFLSFYARLLGFSLVETKVRVPYYLKLTDTFHSRRLQLRKFSKGMLQRIGIAQALINDPKVIFLDEPMSGLDPVGRREVRDLILKLKSEGKTIFFSTHILNDVETLCDRVAVLNRGRLIGSGKLRDLISEEVKYVEILVSGISCELARQLFDPPIPITESGSTLRLELNADTKLGNIITRVEHSHGKVISVNPIRQTMEDYFFKLVGNGRKFTNPQNLGDERETERKVANS
ncbi:MAG TPA: ABC transporter ATP-binding protein [Candidatus Hodarchaeales archaeon]|nr:ABC transporter ATP-binding protein [Candidatus Hodarchaeales archaeon]